MGTQTDGERAVAAALQNLGLKYEEEKDILFLKNDSKDHRRADFFIPRYNAYIEFLGGWDNPDERKRNSERRRYYEKKEVYSENSVRCIYIYPNQLHYVSKVILDGIAKLEKVPMPLPVLLNPIVISLVGIAVFSMMLGSNPKIFGALLFANVALLFSFISTSCPNCKRVYSVEELYDGKEKIEHRLHRYKSTIRWLYSDGSFKNESSEWKSRRERVNVLRKVKGCKYCKFRWVKNEETNLDQESRPTVRSIHTKYRKPARR